MKKQEEKRMKRYRIECNEEQLQLMRSALELQLRLRMGQGEQIIQNVVGFADPDYTKVRDAYSDLLASICKKVAEKDYCNLRDKNAASKWTERDMWVGIEKALGYRTEEIPLGNYGLLKVYEADEETEVVRHGHWEPRERLNCIQYYACSECEKNGYGYHLTREKTPNCPWCRARMNEDK